MASKVIHVLALVALGTACAEEKGFKAGVNVAAADQKVEAGGNAIPNPPAVVVPPVEQKTERKLVEKTLDFEIAKEKTPIDMVWVIDNSGSMSNEIAQVRTNFKKFMDSVSARSDLNVTLVSKKVDKGTNVFGLALEDSFLAAGHLQLDIEVSSYNLLAMTAAGMCPASESTFESITTSKVCGVLQGGINATEMASTKAIAGKLIPRLREGSKKVLVYVTDDNAKFGITPDNFLATTKLSADSTTVYSFSATNPANKAACGWYGIGTAYQDISKKTKGLTFDICEQDWSSNFDKLSASVIKLASNGYSVGNDESKVKKVLLDGVELDASAYKIEKNKVTLLDDDAAVKGATLTVIYEVME